MHLNVGDKHWVIVNVQIQTIGPLGQSSKLGRASPMWQLRPSRGDKAMALSQRRVNNLDGDRGERTVQAGTKDYIVLDR